MTHDEEILDKFMKDNDLGVDEIFDLKLDGAWIYEVFVCVGLETSYLTQDDDYSTDDIDARLPCNAFDYIISGKYGVWKYPHGYKGNSIADFRRRRNE